VLKAAGQEATRTYGWLTPGVEQATQLIHAWKRLPFRRNRESAENVVEVKLVSDFFGPRVEVLRA
jgi:hypothetical protein